MTTNSPMHASTSPLADPNTVQKPNPVSWADMNDDDDFDFPVINLAKFRDDEEDDAVAQPTVAAVHEEAAVSAPAATADRSPVAAQRGAPTKVRAPHAAPTDGADGTPKRNRIISSEDAVYTVPAKVDGSSHGPRSSEKRTVAREGSSGNHHSPSRALLPAFVQITVESTIPYALRSSAASSQNDLDGVGWSSLLQSQNVLEALAGPEKAARKCRSEVRRTKAVQLLREALVSAPEPIPCDDLAKLVGWNRKFRPAVGCLFSFLKKHRDQFAYSKGAVSLVVAQPAADSAASGQTNVAQVAATAAISPELVRGA